MSIHPAVLSDAIPLRAQGMTCYQIARRLGFGATEIESFLNKQERNHERRTRRLLGETAFARLLRDYRDRLGVSQGELARVAGYDRSHISLLESDKRAPSHDTVLELSAALMLTTRERDEWLLSAGLLPIDVDSLMNDDPTVKELRRVLTDEGIPEDARADLLSGIALLVRGAQRA